MMGAVFAEMDKEWVGRRWFNDDSIGRAVEGAVAEHVARFIALVVADSPIPGGEGGVTYARMTAF